MANWDEFTAAEPEMAALGMRLYRKHGLAYLGTTRHDGTPRVNPVCPVIADGVVYVATPERSPKRRDLLRDGRYILHMLPGEQEEEFWIRGTARHIDDAAVRARVIDAAAGITRITPDEWLFAYDIAEAGTTVWLDFGTESHRPQRRSWRAEEP